MKEEICITRYDIPKEMRDRLPKYSKETAMKRDCSVCQYYAGKYHCMLKHCICDENYADRIAFHPVLRELLDSTKKELREAEIRYETAKFMAAKVEKMFEQELKEESKVNDECYECPYSKNSPCVGVCIKKILEGGK